MLSEIDRVTANHDFTNASTSIAFDKYGNVTDYTSSIDHADVGAITSTLADLSVSELSIMGGAYTEISALETVVSSIQSASNAENVAKLALEYIGWSQLENITVDWDVSNKILTTNFDGLFEGEQRTNPTFTSSVGTDGELTVFSYTAGSPSGDKSLSLSSLNDTDLYLHKVIAKTVSDLAALEIAANHTSLLTNDISFDLYKDGSDTNQNLVIDNGELRINESFNFDTIKISDTQNYTQDISIGDAIDVLRHIVKLEEFSAGSAEFHAADIDNSGSIEIGDAIDILRHIVKLEAIDSFDLIDNDGNIVNSIDPSVLFNAPTWILIPNGDTDLSGSFDAAYTVTSDLI